MIDRIVVTTPWEVVKLRRRGLRVIVRWFPAGWYGLAADAPGAIGVAYLGRWRPSANFARWEALARARQAAEDAAASIRGAARRGDSEVEIPAWEG